MSASLHRVLVHGADIIKALPLPPGVMSEEGAEARNKFYKRDRLKHARKISREANLHDLMCRQLISSDPIITQVDIERRLKSRKNFKLPIEVEEMLVNKDNENFNIEETTFDEFMNTLEDIELISEHDNNE